MVNRRQLLQFGLGAAVATPSLDAIAGPIHTGERRLSLGHMHTGEVLSEVYWENGIYNPEAISLFNHFLRDFRTGDEVSMDIRLLDVLFAMQQQIGKPLRYQVLSGFRSEKTNAMLRRNGSGVAKRSYHLKGQAVDISVDQVSLAYLRKAAVSLRAGGVGYYPSSGFMHLDSGPIRRWG